MADARRESALPEEEAHRAAAVSTARYAALTLPDRPRLAPWIVAVDLGDGRLQLRSAESSHSLTHPLLVSAFQRVEKLLDGRHSEDEIISLVGAEFQPTTIVFLLKLLHGKGLLQHGGDIELETRNDAAWQRQIRFLSHFVPNAPQTQAALASSRVGVVGDGDLRQEIVTAMGAIGIDRVTDISDPSTLHPRADDETLDLVVACDVSPGFRLFDATNRACLADGTRWLRVTISGTSAQLGPTFVPYETACYTCLDLRRQTHDPELEGYLSYRASTVDDDGVRDDGTAALSSVVSGQAVAEVMRILAGYAAPVTFGRYYEFSATSPIATAHDVLKVPRCPSCGTARYTEAWDQTMLPEALQ
jgi:bacteriocin biosynthesis cyclodehydratase domain-containing protein